MASCCRKIRNVSEKDWLNLTDRQQGSAFLHTKIYQGGASIHRIDESFPLKPPLHILKILYFYNNTRSVLTGLLILSKPYTSKLVYICSMYIHIFWNALSYSLIHVDILWYHCQDLKHAFFEYSYCVCKLLLWSFKDIFWGRDCIFGHWYFLGFRRPLEDQLVASQRLFQDPSKTFWRPCEGSWRLRITLNFHLF